LQDDSYYYCQVVVLDLFSRTLTAVHDAILEDLCYPSEIVGKRIRIKLDGTRLIKVHLDKAQQTNVEHKVNFEILCALFLKLSLLYLLCLLSNRKTQSNIDLYYSLILCTCHWKMASSDSVMTSGGI